MRFLSLFIISTISFVCTAQVDVNLKTDIKAVKVFLNGAEISRDATVDLVSGQNTIVFKGLSTNIEKDAIRLTADPELSVLSINIKKNYLTEEKDKPAIKILRDSIMLLTDQIKMLDNEKDAYEIEKKVLLENEEIGGENTGVNIMELKQAADFFRSRIFEINQKHTAIQKEISKLNAKKHKLQMQLNELTNRSRQITADLYFVVNSDKAQKVDLKLTYFVYNAGWAPRYEFFSKSSREKIDFKYLGDIYNNTGIDWENVTISLSTGDPQISITKPGLTPWYINYSRGLYDRSQGYMKKSERLTETITTYDTFKYSYGWEFDDFDKNQVNAQSETVSLPDITSDFNLESTYTIPSDYKPYRVKISENELDAVYEHFSIPKVETSAFLLAKVSGWKNLGLIEGPVKVYYEGTYMGESYIYPFLLNDTLDISLGRDQQIIVKRTKLKELCSTKILGANKKEYLVYEIQIKNNRPASVEIIILDQVPVSNINGLDVEVKELSGGELNMLNGEVKWILKPEPGEIKKLQLAFEIKYPKDKIIDMNQGRKKTVTRFY